MPTLGIHQIQGCDYTGHRNAHLILPGGDNNLENTIDAIKASKLTLSPVK
jgi:hypothetical protein